MTTILRSLLHSDWFVSIVLALLFVGTVYGWHASDFGLFAGCMYSAILFGMLVLIGREIDND